MTLEALDRLLGVPQPVTGGRSPAPVVSTPVAIPGGDRNHRHMRLRRGAIPLHDLEGTIGQAALRREPPGFEVVPELSADASTTRSAPPHGHGAV